ncbi:hypothetical protein CK203_080978 [Vitis vinifera]|uniref:Uncharacterized protein n=1 Tax=Vitis vinifera TaxID=29760 RepID=A0A438EMR7_VITVI|nr:hypothetical protein CK203_080978 [Vitis vinifera]
MGLITLIGEGEVDIWMNMMTLNKRMIKGGKMKVQVYSLESGAASQRKIVGKIVERGQGFSTWIRFGERGLAQLLEGVEFCCEGQSGNSLFMGWNEGGRGYKLVLCSNKAGRFLLCSVLSLKDKSFSLVFLEGRDSLRGWKTLASKLREIGVVPKFRKVESSKKVVHLLVDSGGGEAPPKDPQKVLGGRWGDSLDRTRDLGSLKDWTRHSWRGKEMQLDWWRPDVGCLRVEDCVKEVWVRVLGLPLHLWGEGFFKKLRDACGGF